MAILRVGRVPPGCCRGSVCSLVPSRGRQRVIIARWAWASLARQDKLELIPRGACFSLPGPATARPAMFFIRAVWPEIFSVFPK